MAELGRVLIDEARIGQRVRELGKEVVRAIGHGGRVDAGEGEGSIVLLPILTGALVFAADLVRAMGVRMRIEPMVVSSYPGTATVSQGIGAVDGPLGRVPGGLAGKHVVIVDDILDSGATLAHVRKAVEAQGPASVRACVLLAKRKEHAGVVAEHVGFEVEDVFVVGYGLDYDGWYRNERDVRVLEGVVA